MPTAVASCGVYPSNQAALLSVVVPVLPATGRPRFAAYVAVPSLIGCSMASMVSAMTSLSKAAFFTGLAL